MELLAISTAAVSAPGAFGGASGDGYLTRAYAATQVASPKQRAETKNGVPAVMLWVAVFVVEWESAESTVAWVERGPVCPVCMDESRVFRME